MNTDLDALATRLYVTIDDLLIDHPDWAPARPEIGIAPKLTDAELITLAVIQALFGYTHEARFWRHANIHLRGLFPYLPQRPAYSDSATQQPRCNTSSRRSRRRARRSTTTCGSWTPHRSSAAAPVKR